MRAALVTGSTSGIGLAIAKQFAARGDNVVINGLGSDDVISSALNEVNSVAVNNAKAVYLHADLASPAAVRTLITDSHKQFGQLDYLVNNAGIQHVAPIDKFPTEMYDKIIAINMSAVFHSMAETIPLMRAQGFGRIVNVASVHGLFASANKSAYCAAKHGVMGMTKVAALETAQEDITVNAVCPGWVMTDLVRKQIEDKRVVSGRSFEDEAEALCGEKHPSKGFVTVEEVANAVLFLATPQNKQMRGTHILLDGGWSSV